MCTRLLTLIFTIGLTSGSFAQVKIGSNPTTINSASLLELETSNKGVVLPRISITSITSTSPLNSSALNGTIVFNTNATLSNGKGIYYWDSLNTKWIPLSPVTGNGTTNYAAKWISPTVIGTSSILYDDGTGIAINSTTPKNKLDVNGGEAIGTYAGVNTAPTNGLIVSGNVGIGTSSPASGSQLDVNGSFKVGSIGTVTKNIVSFSTSISSTTIPTGYTAITVLGISVISFNTNNDYVDITVPTPSTFSGTQATVFVSPASGTDLPNGVSIASAKLVSTTQVKIRFLNAGTSSQSVSGNFNISVIDF